MVLLYRTMDIPLARAGTVVREIGSISLETIQLEITVVWDVHWGDQRGSGKCKLFFRHITP